LFEKGKRNKKRSLIISRNYYFFNGIRPPNIGLFEGKKKKPIIIWNGFEKNKRSMIYSLETL